MKCNRTVLLFLFSFSPALFGAAAPEIFSSWLDVTQGDAKKLLMSGMSNSKAPREVPLRVGQRAQDAVLQMIVAWQYLTTDALSGNADKGVQEQAEKVGFNGVLYKKFLDLLREYNQDIKPAKKNLLIGGGNASCGYHAIKNALVLINALIDQRPLEGVVNLCSVNMLFGPQGNWRALIVDAQERAQKSGSAYLADATGENLTEDGLRVLWETLMYDQAASYKNMQDVQFFVYGNNFSDTDDSLKFAQEVQDQNLINKVLKYRVLKQAYVEKDTFLGVLLINPRAHWFTLMINKVAGKTQFIIMDSINKPRYDDPDVLAIIQDFTEAVQVQKNKQEEETRALLRLKKSTVKEKNLEQKIKEFLKEHVSVQEIVDTLHVMGETKKVVEELVHKVKQELDSEAYANKLEQERLVAQAKSLVEERASFELAQRLQHEENVLHNKPQLHEPAHQAPKNQKPVRPLAKQPMRSQSKLPMHFNP